MLHENLFLPPVRCLGLWICITSALSSFFFLSAFPCLEHLAKGRRRRVQAEGKPRVGRAGKLEQSRTSNGTQPGICSRTPTGHGSESWLCMTARSADKFLLSTRVLCPLLLVYSIHTNTTTSSHQTPPLPPVKLLLLLLILLQAYPRAKLSNSPSLHKTLTEGMLPALPKSAGPPIAAPPDALLGEGAGAAPLPALDAGAAAAGGATAAAAFGAAGASAGAGSGSEGPLTYCSPKYSNTCISARKQGSHARTHARTHAKTHAHELAPDQIKILVRRMLSTSQAKRLRESLVE